MFLIRLSHYSPASYHCQAKICAGRQKLDRRFSLPGHTPSGIHDLKHLTQRVLKRTSFTAKIEALLARLKLRIFSTLSTGKIKTECAQTQTAKIIALPTLAFTNASTTASFSSLYDFSSAVQEKIIPKLDLTRTSNPLYDYYMENASKEIPENFAKIVKLCDNALSLHFENSPERTAAIFNALSEGNDSLRVLVTKLKELDLFKAAAGLQHPFSHIQTVTAPVNYKNAQGAEIQVSIKDFGTNGPHSGYNKLVTAGFNPEEIQSIVHNALKKVRSAIFNTVGMPEESHL